MLSDDGMILDGCEMQVRFSGTDLPEFTEENNRGSFGSRWSLRMTRFS